MTDWLTALQNSPYTSLSEIPESARHIILDAFRVLGEPFLLALDDIDHDRLTCIRFSPEQEARHDRPIPIYIAQSANSVTHEVRLDSWSCSCAQFALSQYVDSHNAQNTGSKYKFPWGGSRRRQSIQATQRVPFCRHIIASTLQEYGGKMFTKTRKEQPIENMDMDSTTLSIRQIEQAQP